MKKLTLAVFIATLSFVPAYAKDGQTDKWNAYEWLSDATAKLMGKVRVYDNGDRYEGEWRAEKKHGWGTYTSAEGFRVEGEWRYGKLHGWATFSRDFRRPGVHGLTWERFTERYEGEWRRGRRHGWGKMTYSNGDHYLGGWRAGELHGWGTYTFAHGQVRAGEWRDGTFQK